MRRAVIFLVSLLAACGWPVQSAAQFRSACRDTIAVQNAGLAHSLQKFGVVVDSAPPAVRICGVANRYAIAVFAPKRDRAEDYGPRIVVLDAANPSSVRIAYATPGMMDTFLPELYVFPAPERALLLADLGDEGSWGVAPFEITARGVKALTILDVGKPGDGTEPDASAMRHARVAWVRGRWLVRFDTTVVLRPNRDGKRRILHGGADGITFALSRSGWNRVP